jgi:hypothetical protein
MIISLARNPQRIFAVKNPKNRSAVFGALITSLHYFAAIVEEVAAMEMPLNYWRYLESRFRKMDAQWRAQAKFAPATGPAEEETK